MIELNNTHRSDDTGTAEECRDYRSMTDVGRRKIECTSHQMGVHQMELNILPI